MPNKTVLLILCVLVIGLAIYFFINSKWINQLIMEPFLDDTENTTSTTTTTTQPTTSTTTTTTQPTSSTTTTTTQPTSSTTTTTTQPNYQKLIECDIAKLYKSLKGDSSITIDNTCPTEPVPAPTALDTVLRQQPTIPVPTSVVNNEFVDKISSMPLPTCGNQDIACMIATDIATDIRDTEKIDDRQIGEHKQRISDIETIVDKLEEEVVHNSVVNNNIMATSINKIKSHNNGLELALSPLLEGSYLVKINNGCLAVGDKTYDILPCDSNDVRQRWEINMINNQEQYSNLLGKIIDADMVEGSSYPFQVVKSVNNGNCLSNANNNIKVLPCESIKEQRWNVSTDALICDI